MGSQRPKVEPRDYTEEELEITLSEISRKMEAKQPGLTVAQILRDLEIPTIGKTK